MGSRTKSLVGQQTRYVFAAVCGLLAATSGCRESGTQVVEGSVTFNNRPIEEGQIVFKPIAATVGPAAGAPIESGRYEVPAVEQGLRTGGVYRVEISSMVGTGQYIPHPDAPGGKMESLKNIVPPQYNTESELQITVSSNDDENIHDFALSDKR